MFFLALFTPVLGEMALKFQAYEFFWLAVFGVVISGNLTGNDPLKGWMAGFCGPVHRHHRPGRPVCARPLHLRHLRPVGRHLAGAGAGRRVRVCRGADRDAGAGAQGHHQRLRLGDPEVPRRGAVLAHRDPLRPDRHRHRHRAGRRRGRGGLEFLCGGQAREQGAREIRQGLGRGPDGGGDGRQRLRARRHHPGAGAGRSGLGAGGRADGGDAHPRHQSGAR